MLAVINKANAEFIESPYLSGGVGWDFMESETGGDLVGDTDLDGAVATSDTEIDVTSATDLDSSGAIVVYDDNMPDIIEYTGKSSNQLTGVTLIGFAHEDADAVSKLYSLPSDFGKMRQQKGYGDGVRVGGTSYYFTSGVPINNEFSIYEGSSAKFIWFPRGSSGSYSIMYDKAPTSITADTDSVDMPVKYEDFVVYRGAAHGMRVLRLNVDRAQEMDQKADLILSRALKSRMIGKRVSLVRDSGRINAIADGRVRLTNPNYNE